MLLYTVGHEHQHYLHLLHVSDQILCFHNTVDLKTKLKTTDSAFGFGLSYFSFRKHPRRRPMKISIEMRAEEKCTSKPEKKRLPKSESSCGKLSPFGKLSSLKTPMTLNIEMFASSNLNVEGQILKGSLPMPE